MTDEMFLGVSVVVETPTGPLEVEDPANGYWLHKDSFASKSVTFRKLDLEGDYVEGADVLRAVRGNTTESLVIFVKGASHFEMATRVKILTDAFEQLQFGITRIIGNAQEVWSCRTSQYAIETEQAFQHATLAIVRAQVPRLPSVTLSEVTG